MGYEYPPISNHRSALYLDNFQSLGQGGVPRGVERNALLICLEGRAASIPIPPHVLSMGVMSIMLHLHTTKLGQVS